MDGHQLLGDLALYSCALGDGGPRGFRRRGAALPEKYLPGRFLTDRSPELCAAIVRAVNVAAPPAPWHLRQIIDTDDPPHMSVADPPIDRRWSAHGRWAL